MEFHRRLFYLLILLLPTQLGRHFWPDFAFVLGLRVDYLSPTIYLTDLLVLVTLGTWVLGQRLKGYRKWWSPELVLAGAVFAFFLLTSFFVAQNPGAALYKLLKLGEFFTLGFYLVKTRPGLDRLFYPLSAALAWSSALALAQAAKQQTLGGFFWWLGERTFSLGTPGIARALFDGQLFLRPYSTFPHPNALAGFLLVGLILVWGRQRKDHLAWAVLGATSALAVGAIILSFGRTVWLVGAGFAVVLLVHLWRQGKKALAAILLAGLSLFLVGLSLLGAEVFPAALDPSVFRRLNLAQAALAMFFQNPLAGVGLNNFIVRLPEFVSYQEATRFLQPVHNIYLMLAAETGLVGLAVFLWLIYRILGRFLRTPLTPHSSLFTAVVVILALGLFDHYFLTLQQTQLLATLVFSLSWSEKG